MTNHKELYPEQYKHPYCNQTVITPAHNISTVVRVVQSRFSRLALMDNDTMAYQVNQCILVDVIEIERTSADWDCAWLSELRDDSQRVRVYMTDCNDGYIEVLQSGDYLVTAPRAQLHTADLLTAEKFLFEEWLLV